MPIPFAQPIILSERQEKLLKQITCCTTNPYRLVRRAKLILGAASGDSNTAISQKLDLARGQVRWWRNRWIQASEKLASAEKQQLSEQKLKGAIEQVLTDEPRSGTPNFFSTEQVVQIVAIACESPSQSKRPISHWTPRELALEAVKRGVVEQISPRSVGRFLKRSHSQASSSSLLVKR
jgi:putative transposase